MTLGECFVPCRVHGRGVPGGVFCPVQGSWERSAWWSVLSRAGFMEEECLGECFAPYRVDRRVGPGGVFCPVQGSWKRSAWWSVLPRTGLIGE